MTILSPALPRGPEKIVSIAASASSRLIATVTPLPAASPSALITAGAPFSRTKALADAASVKHA